MVGELTSLVKASLPNDRQTFSENGERVDIGARLALVRGKMSQRELARRAKIDSGTVSRIERGDYDPTFSTLSKIAGALGFTIEEFFAATTPLNVQPTPTEVERLDHEIGVTQAAVRGVELKLQDAEQLLASVQTAVGALTKLVEDRLPQP